MKKVLVIIGIIIELAIIGGVIFYFATYKEKYRVRFITNGGNKIEYIEIKENAIFELPETPKKEGYVFAYWTLKDGEPVLSGFPVKNNTTLYAKWIKEDAEIVNIVFDTRGGTKINSLTIEKGTKLVLPKNPEKKNYVFKGWKDKEGNSYNNDDVIDKEGKLVLLAEWEEEKKESNKPNKPNSNKPSTNKDNNTSNNNNSNNNSNNNNSNNSVNTSTPQPTTPTVPTNPEPEVVLPTGIQLKVSTVNMIIFDSHKLNATVLPTFATNKTLTWSSSNPDIVSVDSNGNIKAKKIGSAIITVKTSNGIQKQVMVYSDVSSIKLNISNATISQYGIPETKITATVTPNIDYNLNSSMINYSTSNNYIGLDKNNFKTVAYVKNSPSSYSRTDVTLTIGRKKATIPVYIEPRLSINGFYNNGKVFYLNSGSDTIMLNSNMPVEWEATGSYFNKRGESTIEIYCQRPGSIYRVTATSEANQILNVSVIRER